MSALLAAMLAVLIDFFFRFGDYDTYTSKCGLERFPALRR
jgi:hypothetical protein